MVNKVNKETSKKAGLWLWDEFRHQRLWAQVLIIALVGYFIAYPIYKESKSYIDSLYATDAFIITNQDNMRQEWEAYKKDMEEIRRSKYGVTRHFTD